MMMMSTELDILCNLEIPEVELVPPQKLCTAGQGGVQEDSLPYQFIILLVRPLREPTLRTFQRLRKATVQMLLGQKHLLCVSPGKMPLCVCKQEGLTLHIFLTFLKVQVHKLYKNLDLIQVCFLEEGGFHQL